MVFRKINHLRLLSAEKFEELWPELMY